MTRRCGECTLCCRLLAVKELGKVAGERCRHQRGLGCKVYQRLKTVAPSCSLWNCRWLIEADTPDLARPDRSHYVVDVMPDYVRGTTEAGVAFTIPVIQIWIDPAYPDAHRDPALRAYVERRGAEGMAALVRYGSGEDPRTFTLIPPALSGDGKWYEKHQPPGVSVDPEHTPAEKVRALGGLRFALGGGK